MTPEDEIVEFVERTIATELVHCESNTIPSFPELYILRMTNLYSIRLKREFHTDAICVEKFEKLKEIFKTKQLVFRNMILDIPQSIVFSGIGKVVVNSLHYYDCVFAAEDQIGDLFCHNCVYCDEENK